MAQLHLEIYLLVDWNEKHMHNFFQSKMASSNWTWNAVKTENTYKSEAKSRTVVIPVSNPRPCGVSDVNSFVN